MLYCNNIEYWSQKSTQSGNVQHLTISLLSAILFWRTKLGKTGFKIKGSDLIQHITEDRLRHASGPVHPTESVTYMHTYLGQYNGYYLSHNLETFIKTGLAPSCSILKLLSHQVQLSVINLSVGRSFY